MIVITPVGISILMNCKSIKQMDLQRLERIRADEDLDNGQQKIYDKVKKLGKEKIRKFKKGKDNFHEYSAEIASLEKIIEEGNETHFDIQLFATDSVLSVLSAELMVFWFSSHHDNRKVEISFDGKSDFIKGLRVDNAEEFENSGANNLLNWLFNSLKDKNKTEVQLNITGGYKALTPWLTIFAQLEGLSTTYLYEESKDRPSELIEIASLPVNFDNEYVESFSPFLNDSKLGNLDYWQGFIDEETLDDLEKSKLINRKGKYIKMTTLGVLMFRYFEKKAQLNNSILGKYIELILELYLLKNKNNLFSQDFEYSEVLRGVDYDNNHGNGDYDILLKDLYQSELIICEVKSFSNVRESSGVSEQAEKLILASKRDFPKYRIKEFILFVHGAPFFTQKADVMTGYLSKMKSRIDDLNVGFRVLVFTLPITKNEYHLNINYQVLIEQGIHSENLVELDIPSV